MVQALKTGTNIDGNEVSTTGAQSVAGTAAGSSSNGSAAQPLQSTPSREALRRAYRRALAREGVRKRWIGPFCCTDF
jgi:hypothetical protein